MDSWPGRNRMNNFARCTLLGLVCALSAPVWADGADKKDDKTEAAADSTDTKPREVASEGSVSVEGRKIDYKAIAGTIILTGKDENKEDPTASVFYVAYFKRDGNSTRPLTFIYNGGPGSSTAWLPTGAFGPKR